MRLEHMLFILALVAFALAALWNVDWSKLRPPDPQFESNIEALRLLQRECMQRLPAHSFRWQKVPDGWLITCNPIHPQEK